MKLQELLVPYIDQFDTAEELRFHTGEYLGEVHSVAGIDVTPSHITAIREARSHYAVWGQVEESFLWNGKDGLPTTQHFWCSITHEAFPTFQKTFYMRKTVFSLSDPQQPEEVRFWLAKRGAEQQTVHSLLTETHEPDATFSVFGRASSQNQGSLPPNMNYLQRNMAALACAGTKLLAYQDSVVQSQPFWLFTVQPELQKQVLTFTKGATSHELAFTNIAQWPEYQQQQLQFELDMTNPEVIAYKTLHPGYWMNRASFPTLLAQAFTNGTINLSDTALQQIAQSYTIPTTTQQDFCNAFAHAKQARALADLFVAFPNLATTITARAGDGPYLVKVTPKEMYSSALAMVQAATQKEQ